MYFDLIDLELHVSFIAETMADALAVLQFELQRFAVPAARANDGRSHDGPIPQRLMAQWSIPRRITALQPALPWPAVLQTRQLQSVILRPEVIEMGVRRIGML